MNGHYRLMESTVAARGNRDAGYGTRDNQQHHAATNSSDLLFRFLGSRSPIDGGRKGDSMSLTLNTA